MLKKLLSIAGGIVLAAGTLSAADVEMKYDQKKDRPDTDDDVDRPVGMAYDRNEFSLDFFLGYTLGESTIERLNRKNLDHGDWGGGIGANFFFTRHIGVGADAYIAEDFDGSFIDYASASLIFRFPIDNNDWGLAPYVFGGAGHTFDPIDRNSFHAGAGLEFRCAKGFGIFADARFIWMHRSDDFGLGRLGVRLHF